MIRPLVVTATFPQFPGDPRGEFLRTHWEVRAAQGETVRVLAPRSAWTRGEVGERCEIVRCVYAPRAAATLTGHHGILENIRERPWRAVLVPLLWWSLARGVSRQLRAFRPQRVVAHMLLPAGWVVARVCRRLGIPYEMYGHGTDVDVLLRLPAFLRRRFASLVRGAAATYVPSSEKRTRLLAGLGEDLSIGVETMVHVVPSPGVPRRPRLGGRPQVLFLGRLISQKGVDVLLRAVARMNDPPKVHVAGDGPLRIRLERLADDLGVDAAFHGFVRGVAKDALLSAADLMCVPSRETPGGLSEGAPLVIREALARGLPLVASRVGGIPEMCQAEDGATLVEPGDPVALRAGLEASLRVRAHMRAVG